MLRTARAWSIRKLLARTGSLPLLAAALLLPAAPARGTTYVPMADADLAAQAPFVLEGRVLGSAPAPVAGRPATDYTVEVLRSFKGAPAASPLTVRVPGGETPEGAVIVVWGAPRFEAGERVILFLGPRGDGTFGLHQLMLGAFRRVARGGGALALRDLSGARAVGLDGGPADEPESRGLARDWRGFTDWLAARGSAAAGSDRYLVELPPSVAPRYTLLGSGGKNFRWFDGGGTWFAYQAGQEGMPGGGFAEFQVALEAWNADPGSSLALGYGGTTSARSGFTSADGTSAILFDDPNGEISGSFSCSSGGVLAIGGFSGVSGTGDYAGKTFWSIAEGEIVTQDGAGCFFAGNGGKNGELVFAHELGHALGLGHSCGDGSSPSCSDPALNDALMRAYAHADGRGARLGADDVAAVGYLYGNGGGSEPPPPLPPPDPEPDPEPPPPPPDPEPEPDPAPKPGLPPAPTDLRATAASATAVTVAWTDRSGGAAATHVEVKTGAAFQQARVVPAGTATTTFTGLRTGGTYAFRVRAKNAAGYSAYSFQVSVTLEEEPPPPPPGSLTAAEVACDGARLAGLLKRLAVAAPASGRGTGVSLSLTASGEFAGLAYTVEEAGAPERHLAFSTNPEETTLLRNPERPQLASVSLSRNHLSSDLVAAGDPGELRITLDPTLDPGSAAEAALLAIDNRAASSAGGTSAKPGRGLGALVEACHAGFSADDAHLFRVLSKIVRARVEGAKSYEVAIYRAPQPGRYRIDVYPRRGNGAALGRLAAELRAERDEKGALTGGRLEVLPGCSSGKTTGCTVLTAWAELLLQRPTGSGEPAGAPEARVVFEPADKAAGAAASLDWPALLAGSSWDRAPAGAAGAALAGGEAGAPETAPAPLAAADVRCDGERLAGFLDRLALEGPKGPAPPAVNVSYTRSGDFAGIAYAGGGAERHLAFSTNPEETTLLRNPERPQLFAVSLSRNALASDLVAPNEPGLLRVLLDPTLAPGSAPRASLLGIDNLGGARGGATDAKPGRGLAPLVAPCHGKLSRRDVHLFRVLSKVVRARTEGAAALRVAIFRGAAPDVVRIDVYPQGPGGPPTGWGRLSAELELGFGPDDELRSGTLRVLPRCTSGETAGCTSAARTTELFLVPPAFGDGGEAGGSAVVSSAALPAGAGATSGVDFDRLLSGTTWKRPL